MREHRPISDGAEIWPHYGLGGNPGDCRVDQPFVESHVRSEHDRPFRCLGGRTKFTRWPLHYKLRRTEKDVDKLVNRVYFTAMQLGAEIRRRREAAGLTLRRMAQMARVSPAYLSRVERGSVSPSQSLVRASARALGADPDEFLLLAGRVPADWRKVIAGSPARAVKVLREAFGRYVVAPKVPGDRTVLEFQGPRAIEDADFPFEGLSDIAELESWRKEIYRPLYHLHKWWAQRLGSVFRAIVLGTFAPKGADVMEMFYQQVRLPGAVVFDPFMGSGTTIGEALKLGACAIGRDINPVACFAVKNALSAHSRERVLDAFHAIEADVAPEIKRFYKARLPGGGTADVLYYFWVKVVPCPKCDQPVDLFSSYVIADHAYPTKKPEAKALCPYCGGINTVRYDARRATCGSCRRVFDPNSGPAKGAKASCPGCGYSFLIVKAVQLQGASPSHRLYAKLVLLLNGSKVYLPADQYDRRLYDKASQALKMRENAFPVAPIEPGYNTDQVLNYCYRYWHQMFNDRQLLCLGLLADRIRAIRDPRLRELFACLFSGTLEFNNMFASFKGEGTGAVRHMFSHHILKPERIPLEANLWGTPKSSGAFSTLFRNRLLRALDYCENPFELRVIVKNGRVAGGKVYGLSSTIGYDVAETSDEFRNGKRVYLSCGDSANTDVASESVDAVITDPPFFDNVHYSQLADFFYVWQRHILGENRYHAAHTTRSAAEVQTRDPALFAERLRGVWMECHRVLRLEGLLVFTYHHSRPEGWRCILEAVVQAGFDITATHPIKAEMSVAQPKHQAKEPIDLDVIVACRKKTQAKASAPKLAEILPAAAQEAQEQMARLNRVGRRLSRNDVRVVLMAQIVRRLSWHPLLEEALRYLDSRRAAIERAIEAMHDGQEVVEHVPGSPMPQLELW